MKNANEYLRLIWINNEIKNNEYVTKEKYLEEFEMHARTFDRDIEKLRDRFGAPIIYDRLKRLYKYSTKTFDLPGVILNEQDYFGLVVSSCILSNYKNTPVASSLNKVMQRLAQNLGTSISYFFPNMNSNHNQLREFDFELLQSLSKAIQGRRTIKMLYRSFNSQKESQRLVDPYHIYNFQGEFYLVAFCHNNKEFRDFFTGRIKNIEILSKQYEVKNFDPEKYFSQYQWGIMKGGQRQEIVFEITTFRHQWVKEKFGERIEEIKHNDREYRYKCEVEINDDFIRWLVGLGKDIVIIKPESLRKTIKNFCSEILQNYKKSDKYSP